MIKAVEEEENEREMARQIGFMTMDDIQGSAKRQTPGCVNAAGKAR